MGCAVASTVLLSLFSWLSSEPSHPSSWDYFFHSHREGLGSEVILVFLGLNMRRILDEKRFVAANKGKSRLSVPPRWTLE